jgi:hypothetical protein
VVDLGVVELEVRAPGAAFDDAFAAADDQRGAQRGGDVPAQVRDGRDVAALLDDRGHERFSQQPAYPLDGDGPDPGDRTRLPVPGLASLQRVVVDDDVDGVPDALRLRPARRGEGAGPGGRDRAHERVGGVGILRFVVAGAAVLAEDSAGLVVEDGLHGRALFRRQLVPAGDHPVRGGPHPVVPYLPLPGPPGGLVLPPGPHRHDRVPQRDHPPLRHLQELAFDRRVAVRGRGDELGLLRRQRPGAHRRVRPRQCLELHRGLDRAVRLTRRHPHHARAQLHRGPVRAL